MTPAGDPIPADRVLLLHGTLRSAAAMSRLERALAAAGYRTLNLPYPARRLPIEALADVVQRDAGTFLRARSALSR